jgi:hypothetical protein
VRHVNSSSTFAVVLATALVGIGGPRAAASPAVGISDLAQCAGVSSGSLHSYAVAGGITAVQPPSGFDPTTATTAQLLCYGFPTRPAGGSELQAWNYKLAHATHWGAPDIGIPNAPGSETLPITGTVTAAHATHYNPPSDYPWSGYAIAASRNTGWANLKWNEVTTDWTVPYGHTYCYQGTSGASDNPWVGIGGDGWDNGIGTSLIQAGSNTIDRATKPYTAFYWQNFKNPAYPVYYPPISQGDTVDVDVHYLGNQTTTFFYENLTTGGYTSFNVGTSLVDQTAAEAINEDQPAQWDFVNFGTVPFSGFAAFGTWGSSNQYALTKHFNDAVNLSQFTAYKLGGDTSNHLVAWPTAVDYGGNFTDYATANDGC